MSRRGDRNQFDPNAPLEEQMVTATEQHVVYDLRDVTIRGGDGSTETIKATDEHPFYVEGLGFTGAAQLTVGAEVQTPDGSFATVIGNTDDAESNGVTVYNFTVGTDHTYFVDQGGVGVWVHNVCAYQLRANLNRAGIFGSPGDVVHHLVDRGVYTGRNAYVQAALAKSKAILGRAGIDINAAENGVFLSRLLHNGPSSNSYILAVSQRLVDAERTSGAGGVAPALEKIASDILTGILKIN